MDKGNSNNKNNQRGGAPAGRGGRNDQRGGGRGGRGARNGQRNGRREKRYERQVVSIRRVAKVTSGGKRLRFSAMVVVGDKNGKVGVGLGRGVDTRAAIDKGARIAEKAMVKMELIGDTIPHELMFKKGAAKIMLRPAKLGTGVIAGSSPRIVLEVCGVENVYAKIVGTNDLIANTYATFEALKSMRSERVLSRMTKMKERVGMKIEMDKERKEKEMKKRKEDSKKRREEKAKEYAAKKAQRAPRRPAPVKDAAKKGTLEKKIAKAAEVKKVEAPTKVTEPKKAEAPKKATEPKKVEAKKEDK